MATPTQPTDHADPTVPQVSRDVARVVAACRSAVADADAVPGWTVPEAVVSAAAALSARTTGEMPRVDASEIVLATLAAGAAEHARQAHRAARAAGDPVGARAARALDAHVGSGAFASALGQDWERTRSPGPLDRLVTELTAAGLDGERLSWAVIGFECQRHTRLIWHEANKLAKHFPDRRPADLFGWGWQGLRIAMRGYDPGLGHKFSTYACLRISGAIRDGVRSENPIPKRLTTFVRKVAAAEEELVASLGRLPELFEVAEHLGETLDALRIMSRLSPAASLDELAAGPGDRSGELPWLVHPTDPADNAVDAALEDAVRAAMAGLEPEVAEAVTLLYLQGLTVPEARAASGATARQLRHRCAKGREALAELLSPWNGGG